MDIENEDNMEPSEDSGEDLVVEEPTVVESPVKTKKGHKGNMGDVRPVVYVRKPNGQLVLDDRGVT